jgi:16S rRNA processing protein RimM
VVTDFPQRRFRRGARVYLGGQPYVIAAARVQPGVAYLKLEAVDDRTAAEKLRGLDVEIPTQEAQPLAKGQFYWHQVIGLQVVDQSNDQVLGTIADIIETGANDVYVVNGPHGEILVPAIKDVVKLIDPQAGRMLIQPLPGLIRT